MQLSVTILVTVCASDKRALFRAQVILRLEHAFPRMAIETVKLGIHSKQLMDEVMGILLDAEMAKNTIDQCMLCNQLS